MLDVNAISHYRNERRMLARFLTRVLSPSKVSRVTPICATRVSTLDRDLITKIMSGIRDKKTRMKLLTTSPLPDLQKVADLCRSDESAKLDEARINKTIQNVTFTARQINGLFSEIT